MDWQPVNESILDEALAPNEIQKIRMKRQENLKQVPRKQPTLNLQFLKRFRQQKIQITKLQFKVQICRLKRQAQTM